MNNALKINFRRRKPPTSVLGLALDGSRLEGVVLRVNNGALQILKSFSAELTLDPLTAATDLAGREIRNLLDASGVRERNCVVAVPLKWILTGQTELPALSEADAASLLQIETERVFPTDVASLRVSVSRCALAGGKQHVTLAGVSSGQLSALESVLAAAKLNPLSFSLGLPALQPRRGERAEGVLALTIGEGSVGLLVMAGGGVAALRTLEGAIESEGDRRLLQAEVVAREVRVTLSQLAAELRQAVKRIRIFGAGPLARQLADEMELRFEAMAPEVETVSAYAPDEFGAPLPPGTPVSPACSLAAGFLAGRSPAFEFLPPRPTVIEQLVAKYSSGKLRTAGALAAGVVAIVAGAFLFQQAELMFFGSRWSKMSAKVGELDGLQQQIRQYRPWFDESCQGLSILRQITLAFPEDGVVTAKSVRIGEDGQVVCSGTARDNASLLKTLNSLRSAEGVGELKVEQIRGKSPMQFTFNFHWNGAVP